eukprot:1165793-Alexandrium_andersonii.AAC.1
MACFEDTLRWHLHAAACVLGVPEPEFQLSTACDWDPSVQQVLRSRAPAVRHAAVFSDLKDRLGPAARAALDALSAGPHVKASLKARAYEAMFDDMMGSS